MRKEYTIPVIWQVWGVMNVVAENLEDATRLAEEEYSLPDGDYIDDSLEVDKENPMYGEYYDFETNEEGFEG